jgi:Transposase
MWAGCSLNQSSVMQWFLESLEELSIECRVGHPAKIRAAETRKQKHDRRDARLLLDLLVMEDRFPEIWMPSIEQRDLRSLLRDRHQWMKMRARLQHMLNYTWSSLTRFCAPISWLHEAGAHLRLKQRGKRPSILRWQYTRPACKRAYRQLQREIRSPEW